MHEVLHVKDRLACMVMHKQESAVAMLDYKVSQKNAPEFTCIIYTLVTKLLQNSYKYHTGSIYRAISKYRR